MEKVACLVTAVDLVFVKNGQELGRISRNAIEQVLLDDKSQLTQRLTVTRMVALGAFAFAAPKAKKIKEWCVAINWTDPRGLERTTLFEYSGPNSSTDANRVANKLMQVITRSSDRTEKSCPGTTTAESKACPFCAETIKAAAVICRFCNRVLPAGPSGEILLRTGKSG